jgi:UPF0755 protein
MTGLTRRAVIAAVVALVLMGAAAGGFLYAFDRPGPLAGRAIVVVPKGSGLTGVAGLLERHGIISNGLLFRLGVRLAGRQGQLRAGEFDFPGGISARGVMEILVSGRTVVRKLTIPEGSTTAQVVDRLIHAYGLKGAVGPQPAEGTLLPDTYHYSYGDTRAELIDRMERAMLDTVPRLWPGRDDGLPLTSPRQAVILASIVERETGLARERPLIAGVFMNRLRRNMPLQSDPSVAYGIAVAEAVHDRVLRRPLSRADLMRASPYNTYLNRGLPSEAIANPGRAALEAVMHPAANRFLYFVANGNGGHLFAKTLDEHNRNVRRWRRIRDRRRASPPAVPAPLRP